MLLVIEHFNVVEQLHLRLAVAVEVLAQFALHCREETLHASRSNCRGGYNLSYRAPTEERKQSWRTQGWRDVDAIPDVVHLKRTDLGQSGDTSAARAGMPDRQGGQVPTTQGESFVLDPQLHQFPRGLVPWQ